MRITGDDLLDTEDRLLSVLAKHLDYVCAGDLSAAKDDRLVFRGFESRDDPAFNGEECPGETAESFQAKTYPQLGHIPLYSVSAVSMPRIAERYCNWRVRLLTARRASMVPMAEN